MRARSSSITPAKQREPGGDPQHVAQVHVLGADRREERVVELGEPAEDDGDRDPAQQRLVAVVGAPGEPDGGDHEGPGDRDLDRRRGLLRGRCRR